MNVELGFRNGAHNTFSARCIKVRIIVQGEESAGLPALVVGALMQTSVQVCYPGHNKTPLCHCTRGHRLACPFFLHT